MTDSILIQEMKASVLDGDELKAVALAKKILQENMDLMNAMDEGFLKGIQEAGRLYQEGEYFLPDLICSADAMKAVLSIVHPALEGLDGRNIKKGRIAIATVQGDVHDIGKTIVAAFLTAAGFEVHDLGTDVSNCDIIRYVKEMKPDILALSALLTTTMVEQRSVIEMLKAEGVRDKVKVMVGGAPVSRKWAESISADGYSENAVEAVDLAKELISEV